MKNLDAYETNKIIEDLQEQFESEQWCNSINELKNKIEDFELEEPYHWNQEYLKNDIIWNIDKWLNEETYKQDYIETKFRNK